MIKFSQPLETDLLYRDLNLQSDQSKAQDVGCLQKSFTIVRCGRESFCFIYF